MKYLISVLVSNNITFLSSSIESIFKQSTQNYDIIIVVNTLDEYFYQEVLDLYKHYEKIKKIIRTQSNGYPGKGHNSVLDIFKKLLDYDYLIMIDGDDFLFPNAVKRIDHILNKTKFDVLTLSGNTFLSCNKNTITNDISDNEIIYNLNKQYVVKFIKNIHSISDEYNTIWATPFRLLSLNRKILYKYDHLYDENMYIYDDFLYYMILYKEMQINNINIVNINDSNIYLYNKLNEESVSFKHSTFMKAKSDNDQQKEILKFLELDSFDATKFKIIPSILLGLPQDSNLNINKFIKNIIHNVDSQVKIPNKTKVFFIDLSCCWDDNSIYNQPLGGTQTAIYYLASNLSNYCSVTIMTKAIVNKEINKNFKFITINDEYINLEKPDIVVFQGIHYKDYQYWVKINPLIQLFTWCHHDINVHFVDKYYSSNNFHKYFFVSNWQKNRYIEHFKIDPSNSHVIQNGISDQINVNDIFYDKKEKILIFCSTPYRGLLLAYELFQEIKKQIPDIILKVFSSFERDLLNERTIYNEITDTNQIQNNNLDKAYSNVYQLLIDDPNIKFYGSVPQKELFSHLKTAMILFYPNIYPETCCINILEAMAFDCNIISSSLGAIPETSNGLSNLFDPVIDVNDIDYSPENAISLNYSSKNVSNKYLQSFIKKTVDLINNYHTEKNKCFLSLQKEYVKNCTWKNKAKIFFDILNQSV